MAKYFKPAFLCLFILFLFVASGQIFAGKHVSNDSEKVVIASGGKALFPVIVSPKVTSEVKVSVEDLVRYLSKISGSKFEIKVGDGKEGVAVGLFSDFPEIPFKPEFDVLHPGERQGFEIKSHAAGIYVIGATPRAVDYAVFELLRRFGYRSYFPMKKWEIVPAKKELELAVHIREIPDYYTRRIWPGYGYWKNFRASALQWDRVNGGGGYSMSTGHAYNRIITKHKAEFDAHPEYYGLVKGKRTSSKFCVSNPGLRQLISNYAVNVFEQNPEADSVSMDPSDGGGWCECAECIKLGSPSDRALFLSNTAAEAVSEKFPGKRIGMYAYNQHSPPPTIEVHPAVVVNVATGFIRGGFTLNELLEGWSKKKATIGIREYYDVYIWSFNAPGKAKGGNLGYLKKTIPGFYEKGARYMSAEAGDNWGPNGLGYYLAQQMMWNVDNSKRLDSLTEDFLQNCFGSAAGTMKKFYGFLDGTNRHALCSDLLGRMYRLLDQSYRETAGSPEIHGRLDDLALYTRYCEILTRYSPGKLKTLENLLRFSAKIKMTRMVHSKAVFRRFAKKLPKDIEPIEWKSDDAFSSEEIQKFISDGIAANKLSDFKTVEFSNDLVPAPVLLKQSFSGGKFNGRSRGTGIYYTWVDEKLSQIKLAVTGGLIRHYRDRGNVKIEFFKIGGASDTGTKETLIQKDESVSPDGKTRSVTLVPVQSGLYKIVVIDGNDMTSVGWGKGVPFTFRSDGVRKPRISGTFCFYVPKGTKTLGFFCSSGPGYIIAPDGREMFAFKGNSGFRSLSVPVGMDGRLWKLKGISGSIGLLTVPPFLAIEPVGLLLPEDVVTHDSLNE